jgi:hypothetical protein
VAVVAFAERPELYSTSKSSDNSPSAIAVPMGDPHPRHLPVVRSGAPSLPCMQDAQMIMQQCIKGNTIVVIVYMYLFTSRRCSPIVPTRSRQYAAPRRIDGETPRRNMALHIDHVPPLVDHGGFIPRADQKFAFFREELFSFAFEPWQVSRDGRFRLIRAERSRSFVLRFLAVSTLMRTPERSQS